MKQPASASHDRFHAVRFYEASNLSIESLLILSGMDLSPVSPPSSSPRPRIARRSRAGSTRYRSTSAGLRASGELLMLDAEETLSTFMKDGFPDGAAFRQSVGAVLDGASAGRPKTTVRAYGEMVDCLWKNDATIAAIQLEVLGISSRIRLPFSLLCGYSMGNFYKHMARTRTSAISTPT